jgi:hypothetical protein
MSVLLDSSVLVAALAPDEERHAECLALLLQSGNVVHVHAFLETFSTLTGGRLGANGGAVQGSSLTCSQNVGLKTKTKSEKE